MKNRWINILLCQQQPILQLNKKLALHLVYQNLHLYFSYCIVNPLIQLKYYTNYTKFLIIRFEVIKTLINIRTNYITFF